jgi:endonuclease YncB( thermonuclease family)
MRSYPKEDHFSFVMFLGACALIGLLLQFAHCQTLAVNVVDVHDGDTLRLSFENGFQFDARLQGIDAPELAQHFGGDCRQKLKELTDNTKLKVWIIAEDSYNRKLIKLIGSDYSDINLEMVQNGCAWLASPRRSERDKYRSAFRDAWTQRIGLFSMEGFCQPSKFRKGVCTETP